MRRSVRGCLALSLFGVVSAVIVDTVCSCRRTAPAAFDEQSGELNRRLFSLARYVCRRLHANVGGRGLVSRQPPLQKTPPTELPYSVLIRFSSQVNVTARQSYLSVDAGFPYVGNTAGVAQLRESRTLVQYGELTPLRQRGGGGISTPLPTA